MYELESRDASVFRAALVGAVKSQGDIGLRVEVKSSADYRNMRLFLNADRSAGFALDGDNIVSVFGNKSAKDSIYSIIPSAVAMGGRRLDCFDGSLPNIYSKFGFTAVGRTPFNPDYKLEGWDMDTMGRPDVVLMVYQFPLPDYISGLDYEPRYGKNDGPYIPDDADWGVIQRKALDELADTAILESDDEDLRHDLLFDAIEENNYPEIFRDNRESIAQFDEEIDAHDKNRTYDANDVYRPYVHTPLVFRELGISDKGFFLYKSKINQIVSMIKIGKGRP